MSPLSVPSPTCLVFDRPGACSDERFPFRAVNLFAAGETRRAERDAGSGH